MSENNQSSVPDDLSIYDRAGKKHSGGGALLMASLVAVAALAAGGFLIDYSLNRAADEATVAQPVRSAPPVVHGVISRTAVVPVEKRVAVVEPPVPVQAEVSEAEVTLVNAVNQVGAGSLDSTDGVTEASLLDDEVATGDDVVESTLLEAQEVTVLVPVGAPEKSNNGSLEQISIDEIQRVYSSPAVRQQKAFLPEDELKQSPPKAQAAQRPVRRTAKVTPTSARCSIARRELAAVKSSLARVDITDPDNAYLNDQENYYLDQVGLYCR